MYYQAPLYQRLSADPRIDFTAIFESDGGVSSHDAGYGRPIEWDVNPLTGYRSVFLPSAARTPIDGPPHTLRDPRVIAVLRRERFDALWIHGYHFLAHVLAAEFQRAAGRAVLFRDEQTLLHERDPGRSAVKRWVLPCVFRRAYGLYIGTENRAWFENYGVEAGRLFFAPYAVDNETLQLRAAELSPRRNELRSAFGIRPGAGPLIVTVSRLIPKKQPLFLLEAFRRVRETTACVLLVAGSGELETAMREKVRRDEIPDVVFAGFLNQSEIGNAYAAADVFVLASREHETWGLAVNEAMNFGLPVIVSQAVGCATDLVREGENGFVVPPTNVDALAARLLELVASYRRRREFSKKSLERIEPWNYDVTASGIIAAVASAVGEAKWGRAAQGLTTPSSHRGGRPDD